MKRIVVLFGITLVTLTGVIVTGQPEPKKKPETAPTVSPHVIIAASDVKWEEAPPGVPPGSKMAVLDGDPAKEGSFTVRLKAPAGYKVMPHTHPIAERVTVISGTLDVGMGEKFDTKAMHKMKAGDFAVLPAGMAHFVWSSGESIAQIQSEGPFQINYVNPADDPRNAQK